MFFAFGRALVSIDTHVITRFWQNGPGYRVSMVTWRGTNAARPGQVLVAESEPSSKL